MPSRIGWIESVIASPGFNVAGRQPARARCSGLVISMLHCSSVPLSFLTSISMKTCGLVQRNSLTAPSSVTVADWSNIANEWCASAELAVSRTTIATDERLNTELIRITFSIRSGECAFVVLHELADRDRGAADDVANRLRVFLRERAAGSRPRHCDQMCYEPVRHAARLHALLRLLERERRISDGFPERFANHVGELAVGRGSARERIEFAGVLAGIPQHTRAEGGRVAHVDQRDRKVLRPWLHDLALFDVRRLGQHVLHEQARAENAPLQPAALQVLLDLEVCAAVDRLH